MNVKKSRTESENLHLDELMMNPGRKATGIYYDHRTFNIVRTRLMKKRQQFSRVSGTPDAFVYKLIKLYLLS